MKERIYRTVTWSIVGLFIILATAGLALQALAHIPYSNVPIPVLIISTILAGTWPVVGALIVSRHPRHPIGWLLCLGIIGASIDMFAFGYVAYDFQIYSGSLPGATLALVWLSLGGVFPIATTAFTLILLLFPDGHLPSPGQRVIAWAAVGTLLFYLPLQALEPGPVDPSSGIFLTNPLGVSPSLWAYLRPLLWTAYAMLALCNLAAVIALIFRLRRAQGDERQQIKWLVYPAALFWLSIPFDLLGIAWDSQLITGIGIALGLPSVIGIVIAVAFAIFKYRLYDIDLIVNRSLVYGVLTGTLGLIYVSSVVLLQWLLPFESPLALVLSTLTAAALFSPLRRRIQDVIDKHFYRRKYDTRYILDAFSLEIRDEVELERLCETVLVVIDEALQPAHASLWLMKPGNGRRKVQLAEPSDLARRPRPGEPSPTSSSRNRSVNS